LKKLLKQSINIKHHTLTQTNLKPNNYNSNNYGIIKSLSRLSKTSSNPHLHMVTYIESCIQVYQISN